MPVKAYITQEGEIIKQSTLNRYAIKSDSKQIKDTFTDSYGEMGLIEPIYNLDVLAQLPEINTWHYRACEAKARDTAGNGWYLKAKEDIDNPDETQKERFKEFIDNLSEPLTETLYKGQFDYESIGQGALELIRNADRELTDIKHIPAHTIRRHKDTYRFVQKRGGKTVWFKAAGYEKDVDYLTGEEYDLGTLSPERRANEIFFIYNYSSRSDYYGMTEVMPALMALLGDRESQEYNVDFFENHAVPDYVVTVTGADLDADTETIIKDFFNNKVKESKRSTLVLTAQKESEIVEGQAEPIEFKFEKLTADIKDSSFRLYRQDNRDEILAAHGVPKYRAGIAETGSLGQNVAEQQDKIYRESIINPRQEMLKDRINKYILAELEITDYVFRFNDISNEDKDKDAERHDKYFNMGALSPNEIRQELGKDPIDDEAMDAYYINGKAITGPLAAQPQESFIKAVKQLQSDLREIVKKY